MCLIYARAVYLLCVRVVKIGSVPGDVTMANHWSTVVSCPGPWTTHPPRSAADYLLLVFPLVPASGTDRSLSRDFVGTRLIPNVPHD